MNPATTKMINTLSPNSLMQRNTKQMINTRIEMPQVTSKQLGTTDKGQLLSLSKYPLQQSQHTCKERQQQWQCSSLTHIAVNLYKQETIDKDCKETSWLKNFRAWTTSYMGQNQRMGEVSLQKNQTKGKRTWAKNLNQNKNQQDAPSSN